MVWSFRRLRGLSDCIVCSSASNLLLPRGFDEREDSVGRTRTGSLGSSTELTASIEGVSEGCEDFEEKLLP